MATVAHAGSTTTCGSDRRCAARRVTKPRPDASPDSPQWCSTGSPPSPSLNRQKIARLPGGVSSRPDPSPWPRLRSDCGRRGVAADRVGTRAEPPGSAPTGRGGPRRGPAGAGRMNRDGLGRGNLPLALQIAHRRLQTGVASGCTGAAAGTTVRRMWIASRIASRWAARSVSGAAPWTMVRALAARFEAARVTGGWPASRSRSGTHRKAAPRRRGRSTEGCHHTGLQDRRKPPWGRTGPGPPSGPRCSSPPAGAVPVVPRRRSRSRRDNAEGSGPITRFARPSAPNPYVTTASGCWRLAAMADALCAPSQARQIAAAWGFKAWARFRVRS